ncbi:MAG: N-acetylmuramoyl-L-alanine amidase [Firmicutes bacterium]|nr:N-acetylmuramoyl-L-alanine amidase [Bacillota bacterium]
MKVCIDPGHGGSDPGACGNGLQEKDIALTVALKVRDYLTAAGCTLIMTRETDKDVGYSGDDATTELQARCNISNNFGADVFVSIHCNSFSNSVANGTETIYCAGSPQSAKLAEFIQNQLIGLGDLVDRGLKTDSLYVTKHTDAPAVLTELAFISNQENASKLGDQHWQDEFARAIARGVTDYAN